VNGWLVSLIVIADFVVSDAVPLVAAQRRFRRGRLITLP
jgi:hypothetical protein